jgi:uncharacterized protein YcfL
MMNIRIAALCAVPILLGACTSTGARHAQDGRSADAADGSDAAIEAKLEILAPQIVQAGDERRLELAFRNKTAERVDCSFTIDWYDKAGKLVALAPMSWNRLTLGAHGSQPVRIEPMPQAACSWRPRFRNSGGAH